MRTCNCWRRRVHSCLFLTVPASSDLATHTCANFACSTKVAFDPRRTAILLLGGCKSGDERWYETSVPVADNLYDQHIAELLREGLI